MLTSGERGAADRNSAFLFLWTEKTPGEAVNVSDGADSFPGRRDGTVKILAARIHSSPP